MASVTARRTKADRGGHPLLTGILIGLVAGVGLSAAVAVWVARMPSPFKSGALDNGSGALSVGAGLPAPAAPATQAAPAAGGSAPGPAASGAGVPASAGYGGAPPPYGSPAGAAPPYGGPPGAAPSYGSPASGASANGSPPGSTNGNVASGGKPADAGLTKPVDPTQVTLQVGAFASEEDALRQVETIAQVSGVRARVLPPEGAEHLYRVRIGPMLRDGDYAELVESLKANGIVSTVAHSQVSDAAHSK